MSEHPAAHGRLRALTLGVAFAALSTVGALLLAIEAETVLEAVVLAAGLVAGLVAVWRWTSRPVTLVCLAVAAVVWVLGVVLTQSSTASWGLAVVGTVVVRQLPQRRMTAVLGLTAFAAAVVLAELLTTPGPLVGGLLPLVVGAAGVALGAVVQTSLHGSVHGLISELEGAREREAELAVARERVRFASDLHDIQGHTLHVVKLKVALARRLLNDDVDRVKQELGEVYALVGDTISQTKDLAHAQRRLNLSVELENAKNLFEATDVQVEVVRDAEVDPHAAALMSQVLRETTTNVLRHALATQVRISLTRCSIVIDNDGAQDDQLPELRGLAALRDRVAQAGGVLTTELKDGRFRTAATLPRPRAEWPVETGQTTGDHRRG